MCNETVACRELLSEECYGTGNDCLAAVQNRSGVKMKVYVLSNGI
jgi:hypothetical protein